MITVSTQEQFDQLYDICHTWLGMRYRIKNNEPELYLSAWTMLIDTVRWFKNGFKHIPKLNTKSI